MAEIKALDGNVNIGMFVSSLADRFKGFLAAQLSAEEKLNKIIDAMGKDVQEKRVLARQIGAQMRAIADPDTKELEPLEALRVRREKLVALGGKILSDSAKKVQLGQIQQEIKALDAQISSQQSTYDTLVESYNLAKGTYQEALNAFETVKRNGPAMIKAIEAQKAAINMRDKAAGQSGKIDTGFLDDLTQELSSAQAELRSDKQMEDDLDATASFNVDDELAKMDVAGIDDKLMAEFQAAAAGK